MKNYLGVALAGTALLWGACGGDVKVDGEAGSQREGQGGAGPSSSSSSSSGSGAAPSTSSGPTPSTSGTGPTPVCDCFAACNKLVNECGAGDLDCNQFCAQVPPDIWTCICDMPGCDLRQCVGSGTGGSGGGSPSCGGCLEGSFGGTCSAQADTCIQNVECVELFECHFDCGFDPDCNQKCDDSFPGGFPDFLQLVSCSVCGQCFNQCSQTGLIQYCLEG